MENGVSDHITLLNAYNLAGKLKREDTPSFMNMRAIKSAHDIHKQIMEYCADITSRLSVKMDGKVVGKSQEEDLKNKNELVLKCLCKGLPLNIAQKMIEQDKPEETKGVCYKAKVIRT